MTIAYKFEARSAGFHAARVMAASLMMSWVGGRTTWWSSLGVLLRFTSDACVWSYRSIRRGCLQVINFYLFFAIKQWIVKRIMCLLVQIPEQEMDMLEV